MSKITIVFRAKSSFFHSIENVFNTLIPFLEVEKIELPNESKGLINLIKNILHLRKLETSTFHISGHDHYLLWFPFRNAILTIHDIESLKRKSGFKRWLFQKLWFDWPIKNARVITTISEFSKKELLSLHPYKTPIRVIPNPITLSIEAVEKEFNSTNPRILHIGTKVNKNLHRLIEAMKEIKGVLVIIGQLNDDLRALLREYSIVTENKNNLSVAEICDEYKKCDLLAFVSTYEGFGLPIIEAQSAGRPVLSSNCSSMPEVAGKGALLVNPYKVEEIRKGILKIINDGELRNNIVMEGFENVKRFEVTRIAKQYSNLYEELNDG